jgi:hypothetical protein
MALPEARMDDHKRWKWWAAAAIVTGLLLGAIAGATFLKHMHWSLGETEEWDSPAVITQVKQLNELVTVRYSLERVVGLKEAREPLGEESILLMVEGEVLAGIDLGALKPGDCEVKSGRVTLTLPAAKILHVGLNEKNVKVWDRKITWWTPWVAPDPDLEHKARLAALDDMQAAAIKMGVLDVAQRHAQTAIEQLLHGLKLEATVKTKQPRAD